MSNSNNESLEFLFHPRSIALAGITTANPEHWTRTFLNGLLELGFESPIYLVNPKGGEIEGVLLGWYLGIFDQSFNRLLRFS